MTIYENFSFWRRFFDSKKSNNPVAREPVKLLAEEAGGYARDSDGKTAAHWILEEYFPGVSRVQE